VDLTTNALIPNPEPTSLVTKTTGVKFVPATRPTEFRDRAPRFMEFMDQITSEDPEMSGFLLLWFGASLFGFTPEQRFLLMTGVGRNGKGALKHSVLRAVGEYGAQFDANLYMRSKFGRRPVGSGARRPHRDQGQADHVLLRARGQPLQRGVAEGPHRRRPDHGPRPALEQRPVWDPTHSITFLVNDAPEVDDLGPSMAARVMVADFRERFDGEREDKQLYGTLKGERSGILAILCWAASAWYQSWSNDRGGLTIPERVREQSQKFMERNDPIAAFIDEWCNTGVGVEGNAGLLFDAYREWHGRAGRDDEPMSKNRFAEGLEKKGFSKFLKKTGTIYRGIKPKSAMELALDGDDGDE
jgi:putative DNA primase/helicase